VELLKRNGEADEWAHWKEDGQILQIYKIIISLI
jgi:hypothetical protein